MKKKQWLPGIIVIVVIIGIWERNFTRYTIMILGGGHSAFLAYPHIP